MRQRLGGRTGAVALAVFLALDVLLVAAAMRSTGGSVKGGGTIIGASDIGGTPSTTTTAAGSARPSAKTTAPPATTTATTPTVDAVPLTVGVVALGPSTALRFSTGSCHGGGSSMEVTRDGGSTWSKRSAPFDAVLRVRARSDGSVIALGADQGGSCQVSLRRTSAYDGSWGGSASASASWYRDPQDPTRIAMPSSRTATPCGSKAVLDLSVTDSGAAVLCEGGAVRTSKTGSRWSTSATVPGALALALSPQGTSYVAAIGIRGCDGVAVVDSASPSTVLHCAEVAPAALQPGTVALSVSPSSSWLLVGDTAYRADGRLGSWKQA